MTVVLELMDAPAPVPAARAGPHLRVVVADNDADALDLAVMDLGLEGHVVVGQARQGDQAIELVRRLRPDVLVVDVRMPPGPDGLEVARALRDVPALRVVVYSNYSGVDTRTAARRAGAVFVPKGSLTALRAAVAGQ